MGDIQDAAFRVYDLAEELGWHSRVDGASESTSSLYIELTRSGRGPDDTNESIEDYGLTGLETIIVRIADHGNAHRRCEEVMHARLDLGADESLAALRDRLCEPFHDSTQD